MSISKCINFCDKGRCSNCGNCCTEMIPLTYQEVMLIKAYVKEKNIKPYSDIFCTYEGKERINLVCPFRDLEAKKCRIYEVRPKICRVFKCNQDANKIDIHKNKAYIRAKYNHMSGPNKQITNVYSTRETIYGDNLDTIRLIVGELLILNKPVSTQGVINALNEFGREDIAKPELVDRVLEEFRYLSELARGDKTS